MTVLELGPNHPKPPSSTLDMVESMNRHNGLPNNKKNKKTNDGSQQLLDEIKQLSQYFTQLIDTIPPKIYFNRNEDILEKIESEKKRKFEDAPLTTKAKNKRIKFDSNAQQKVSDIANAYYVKKKSDNKVSNLRKKLAKRIKELQESRGATNKADSSRTAIKKDSKEAESPNKNNMPQIYNKDGNLVFSKFDFATHVDVASEKAMKDGKKKKQSLKGLLDKAKKEEKKITKVAQTNPGAAIKMKEKKLWKNALEKTEGHKVRDNPKLIEKALKQKKKQKVKHAKAWAERKNAVEKRQQFKQEKRQRHIDERKQKKKDKQLKLLKKKGRTLN